MCICTMPLNAPTLCVQVLDVTQFMLEHPGGKRVIMMSGTPWLHIARLCVKVHVSVRECDMEPGMPARTRVKSST
jgi:hypothetical protein